jgi:hypothetical protein
MKRGDYLKRRDIHSQKLELSRDYMLEAWIIRYFDIDQRTLDGWFRKGLPKYVITRKLKLYRDSELKDFFDKHKLIFPGYNDN